MGGGGEIIQFIKLHNLLGYSASYFELHVFLLYVLKFFWHIGVDDIYILYSCLTVFDNVWGEDKKQYFLLCYSPATIYLSVPVECSSSMTKLYPWETSFRIYNVFPDLREKTWVNENSVHVYNAIYYNTSTVIFFKLSGVVIHISASRCFFFFCVWIFCWIYSKIQLILITCEIQLILITCKSRVWITHVLHTQRSLPMTIALAMGINVYLFWAA